ncbi:MAG: hypothetical protein HQ542_06175, partial [Bacteroidia bacterium]|nr:hypothetical protein [Bacteroidia bacterium]
MLDVIDPSRGILIPGTIPDSIPSPAIGLISYNTASNALNYYDGTQWIALCAVSTGVPGAGGSHASIGVAIKTDLTGPHQSAMLDVSATNMGLLIPRLSNTQRNAILPAQALLIYNSTANTLEFYNGSDWQRITTNLLASPASGFHVPSTNQITWKWNPVPGAPGYKWSASNDYAMAIDIGTDIAYTETGLDCETSYTRYVWAYNGCGNSVLVSLTQSTLLCWAACGDSLQIYHMADTIAPVDKLATYGTVQNIPGEETKCWITSNLGADHQAIAVNDATEA